MIAKLASGGSQRSSNSTVHQSNNLTLSSQSKRKRSKLLNLLLNTNWSKQGQQVNNLNKLNKILLACDANFLDEKTGESPMSLAIGLPQTATINRGSKVNGLTLSTPTTIGCPQSTSLFSLQSQSTASQNRIILQQTNVTDICHSKAPLIERILLLLIKSGAMIDFRNNDGRTPLHVAALKSNFWALKTLLDLGASNDYRDINGLTPLYYSILHKAELKVTQLLLSHNSKISSAPTYAFNNQNKHVLGAKSCFGITDQQGWQEVHQASKLGLDAHLDKLLYYGCDINAKIRGSGNTPLHVAAINDQIRCAEVLLLRGADKTITNNSHQTAHQVAVISGNMELAEFIAQHDNSKVVLFDERTPKSGQNHHTSSSNHTNTDKSTTGLSSSISSHLVSSQQSSNNNLSQSQSSYNITNSIRTGIIYPMQQNFIHHESSSGNSLSAPLTIDVQTHHNQIGAQQVCDADKSLSNGLSNNNCGRQQQLTLQPGSANKLSAQMNNISPSLSQRSCATSTNTTATSSSGVYCDGNVNQSGEEFAHSSHHQSNITIISVGKSQNLTTNSITNCQNVNSTSTDQIDISNKLHFSDGAATLTRRQLEERCVEDNDDDEDDSRSVASSSNGLQSLVSEDRPLYAGSFVEATSEYQSGDPSHLQLHRGDLIEVRDYPSENLHNGQPPRLANKPLIFGMRHLDGAQGLFPSFCVRRSKRKLAPLTCLKQRAAMGDLTNSQVGPNQPPGSSVSVDKQMQQQQQQPAVIDQKFSMPESRSMFVLDQKQSSCEHKFDQTRNSIMNLKHSHVKLSKHNGGFGFVLKGAGNPLVELNTTNDRETSKVAPIINERALIANNLVSLHYFDNIEKDSAAHKAGLNRCDFLVAVNGQDVRLLTHEQVVHLIRQSGDQVQLTVATILAGSAGTSDSKISVKVKPEPPKRDPMTTLTKNKSQRIKSMPVAPQLQAHKSIPRESFDADKPLPNEPLGISISPTGSLETIGRSFLNNPSHFQSIHSLSSGVPDTHSISSLSTVGSNIEHHHQHSNTSHSYQQQQRQTPNQSSSSTTTLTTVTTKKPEVPMKPDEIQLEALQITSTNNLSYQPAIITNNPKRNLGQTNSSPVSILPANLVSTSSQINGSNIRSPTDALDSNVVESPPSPSLPPPPPPPPPPLPGAVSHLPQNMAIKQRRTSAPVIQPLIDANRTLRKRESLAIVHPSSSSNGPPQMSDVAAACAAAANSRMLRQQAISDQSSDKASVSIKDIAPIKKVEEQTQVETIKDDNCVPKSVCDQMDTSSAASGQISNHGDIESTQAEVRNCESSEHDGSVHVPDIANVVNQNRQISSASLGRRSSAQIIQQPKPNYASQSQTLRVKPRRSVIPSFEQPVPLSPPMPPIAPDVFQLDAKSTTRQLVTNESSENEIQNRCQLKQCNHHIKTNESSSLSRRQSQSYIHEQSKLQQANATEQYMQHQNQMSEQLAPKLPQHQRVHSQRLISQNGTRIIQGTPHHRISATLARSQCYHDPQLVQSVTPKSHHHHHHHQRNHDRDQIQRHHHHIDQDMTTATAIHQQHQSFSMLQQMSHGQHHQTSQVSSLQGASCIHHHQPQQQLQRQNQAVPLNLSSDQHIHPRNHQHTHRCSANIGYRDQLQSQRMQEQHYNQQYQQQQQLYQQMQRQQFIERYLPLVYPADPHAATMER